MSSNRQPDSGSLVVVITRLAVHEHERIDGWVARFDKLALTAYGETRDGAIQNYKKLFNRFVHRHREIGQLEQRLDKSGVEWCWADQYDAEYEDTNRIMDTSPPSNPGHSRSSGLPVTVQPPEIILPAAA